MDSDSAVRALWSAMNLRGTVTSTSSRPYTECFHQYTSSILGASRRARGRSRTLYLPVCGFMLPPPSPDGERGVLVGSSRPHAFHSLSQRCSIRSSRNKRALFDDGGGVLQARCYEDR